MSKKNKTKKIRTPISVFFGDESSSNTVSSAAWLAAINVQMNTPMKDIVLVDLVGNISDWATGGGKGGKATVAIDSSLRGVNFDNMWDKLLQLHYVLDYQYQRRGTNQLKDIEGMSKTSSLSIIFDKLEKQDLIRPEILNTLIDMFYDSGSVAIVDGGAGQTCEGPIHHKNIQNILVCENTTSSFKNLKYLSSQADKIVAVTDNEDGSFITAIEEETGHQVSAIIPVAIEPRFIRAKMKRVPKNDADRHLMYNSPLLMDNKNVAMYGASVGNMILEEIGDSTWSILMDNTYTKNNHNWDMAMGGRIRIAENREYAQFGYLAKEIRCAGITVKGVRCNNKINPARWLTDNNAPLTKAGYKTEYNIGAPLCHYHQGEMSEKWVSDVPDGVFFEHDC